MGGVIYHRGKKFDLQLEKALIDERRLGEIFEHAIIEKIELKSETHQWEQTGNICIEYRSNGELSGIAATEADMWVHELMRDGKTLLYLMIPVERLKELGREQIRRGKCNHFSGDGCRQSVFWLRLWDLLR